MDKPASPGEGAREPPLRLGFAGTSPFAATILERLIGSSHQVAAVYTQPDRRAGRGRKLKPSAVRVLAEATGIAVHVPERLGQADVVAFAEFDCLTVAAYGLLLPPAALTAPRYRCVNVHASLLPRWRGAAPIERAIMAGDRETGVSIMQVHAGLDTGPVYLQRSLPLDDAATGEAVTAALAALGADALLDALETLPTATPVAQDDELVTLAPKLTAAEAAVDWTRDVAVVDRQVRALAGRMTAHTSAPDDVRIRILRARPWAATRHNARPGQLQRDRDRWSVACRDGALELLSVQLNRGKGTPQAPASVANGYPGIFFDGAIFGR